MLSPKPIQDPIAERACYALKQNNPVLYCVSNYAHWTAQAATVNLDVMRLSRLLSKVQDELRTNTMQAPSERAKIKDRISLLEYNISKQEMTADLYLKRADCFRHAFLRLNRQFDDNYFRSLLLSFQTDPKGLK